MDEMVTLLGGVPVFYELRVEEAYLPDFERLYSLVTPRTKAMFVNSPSNPTGAVFPAGWSPSSWSSRAATTSS